VIPVRVPDARGPGIDVRRPAQNPCTIQLLLDDEVYFAELSATIVPDRAGDLRTFVADAVALNADRALESVEVIGWASVDGDNDTVNLPLSAARAAAARSVIEPVVGPGVHIADTGGGETDQFQAGLDEASLAANRVVQLFLTFDCPAP
jgi:outer membrane protein OmpA-like peptidoglycan-associated protein